MGDGREGRALLREAGTVQQMLRDWGAVSFAVRGGKRKHQKAPPLKHEVDFAQREEAGKLDGEIGLAVAVDVTLHQGDAVTRKFRNL